MSSSTGTVVFNDSRIKAKGVIATESIGVGTANPTDPKNPDWPTPPTP